MRLSALAALLAALAGGCQKGADPITDLQTTAAVSGYALRLPADHRAEPFGAGWRVMPADAVASREPVEFDVALRPGSAPSTGDLVSLGERRLRRSVERVEGGSSGDGRLLSWSEDLGAMHAVYAQTAYADGAEPRFELDALMRGGGLEVLPAR